MPYTADDLTRAISAFGEELAASETNQNSSDFCVQVGVPRVVASLWTINSRVTAELMVRFYKKMLGSEKLSPSAALRAAQVEILRDSRWQHPYFWAGFVMQGEWKPVN